ncbi:Chloramphenicol acetyltransferase-like domain [Fusarium acutatum]|uniref:Chloramphenicol acetyltransferase-like domain n=1 Tax=Fusarium acutatum TaxID=78861 RepID=A0A8H4JUX9_9HYPO|nr:Chloramphenicol acetyltransferase-like domain [Fusarium acutatum]
MIFLLLKTRYRASVLKPIKTAQELVESRFHHSRKYYGQTTASEKNTHPLTIWDCEPNMTPILAWALRGDVNVERMSNTLKLSVLRKAPWLTGRLAWREKRFKIDIPEASQERSEPFRVTTFKAPERALHEILPNYIPGGSSSPSVKRFDPRKVPCLQPLAAFTKTAHQCVIQNERLMHVHFVIAKDLTLMCVAWQHIVLDAPALKLIVAEWECLLAKDIHMRTHDPDNHGPEIEGLKDRPNLDELTSTLQTNSPSSLSGWAAVTLWGGLKLKLVSKIYSLRYPRTFGTAYLPPKLVAGLVSRIRSNAGPGVVLSRNDIVASWFYKATCGIYQPRTATTLSRAVNLRGKHDLISPSVSGNVLGLAVMPSVKSGAFKHASLEDLALATRRSVDKFKDPDYVSKFLGFRMNCGNANRIAIPEMKLSNQRCLITSFVNLGLSNPNFGEEVSVERPVQLTMEPVVIRVIDDARGGWSFHGNLPHAAWDALERNMGREMEDLDAKSQPKAIEACVKGA